MSASDARESIGKVSSLKERMAALQGKGGFGGTPPVAPKPAVEKPKWKPPPVVVPADKGDDEHSRAEPSKSPPATGLTESEATKGGKEAGLVPDAEEADQAEVDPEEEERQRRAAIAARMARLGGARVGMAPMFGHPPAVKKPEPKEEPAKVPSLDVGEGKPVEDVPPGSADDGAFLSFIYGPSNLRFL
jgi:hypothetical protein